MTYTAEQLREWAEQIDGVSSPRPNTETIAEHYLAFADTLEENARLRAELGKFSDRNGYALRQRAERAEAALAELRQKLMRYEHAEAADILHPPQDEQARADFPEEK